MPKQSLQCHIFRIEPAHFIYDVSTWGLRITPYKENLWDDTAALLKKKKKSPLESSFAAMVLDAGEDRKGLVNTLIPRWPES